MERKLASIRRIGRIEKHSNADTLEICHVDGWRVISRIGEFKEGELVVYCEVDSFLPVKEEFEFLRKSSFRKMGDKEGFRLRTIKLRQELSQGLILPLSVLNDPDHEEMQVGVSQQPWGDQLQLGPYDNALVIEEGVDVTEHLGIIKWDPPLPACLGGVAKGNFPSFIRKTDEERIQNLANRYENLKKETYYFTEKLDGSSATYYFKDGQFGVCSRNLDLVETEGNTFWNIARMFRIEEKLGSLESNFAIQCEIIGEGIQGNPYKIKGQTFKVFNIFNIDTQEYLGISECIELLKKINVDIPPIEMVPILGMGLPLPETIEELIEEADGPSELNGETMREGMVIRNHSRTVSFKAISNSFLLGEK